jgi:hypothetical protein
MRKRGNEFGTDYLNLMYHCYHSYKEEICIQELRQILKQDMQYIEKWFQLFEDFPQSNKFVLPLQIFKTLQTNIQCIEFLEKTVEMETLNNLNKKNFSNNIIEGYFAQNKTLKRNSSLTALSYYLNEQILREKIIHNMLMSIPYYHRVPKHYTQEKLRKKKSRRK